MRTSPLKEGLAWRWLAAAALLITVALVLGLAAVVVRVAGAAFWPAALVELTLTSGERLLGEVWDIEPDPRAEGATRLRLKTGNRDLSAQDFRWIRDEEVVAQRRPADAWVVERREYGNFYGTLEALRRDGEVVATGEALEEGLRESLAQVHGLLAEERMLLRRADRLHRRVAVLELESAGATGEAQRRRLLEELERARAEEAEAAAPIYERIAELNGEAAALEVVARTAAGVERVLPVAQIVRAVPVNRLGIAGAVRVYLDRWWEFLAGQPRESNTEGGIFPAIFGTALMVFLMTFAVVPLGVVAAVYLNEYAGGGWFTRSVRLALANLAGVPSIVFGAFGLAFFVYAVGGTIDSLFFPDRLPTPTFGTGGILWASLTLALLTVPVVVVATEEGLQSVPNATREGARALGATRWQSLRHVILPYAAPGILTGAILAVARAAGEVAPLMLTGVVKLAPRLPLDGTPPYLHLERKFMHLGFHIYDVGFQSPNVEAAKPMVYATTLVLLVLVAVLNLLAITLRSRLRRKLQRSAV
jgi:phosphate transport system permease protein